MGRKTILRPRREFVRAPVHEAERRAVAVHDPLWATGGAGGIEDIGKRLLAGRGGAVADRPQQHQLLAELLRNSEGGATRKDLPAVDSAKRFCAQKVGNDSADRAVRENVAMSLWRRRAAERR